MQDKYLIIADDFTGSNDTGVQLKRRGYSTKVWLYKMNECKGDQYSVVIDTESRTIPKEKAYMNVKTALSEIQFSDYKHVIKKVDSTLRGNISLEIKAVDEAYHPDYIIFAPALPDMGRTTLQGIHYINGMRLTDTELAGDPKNPVNNDCLKDILSEAYSETICQVSLEQLKNRDMAFDKARIFCFDAVKNEDLRDIISAVMDTKKRILWVGTAGIVDNLMKVERRTFPVLASIASVSSLTIRQVKYCEKQGNKIVLLPIHKLLNNEVDVTQFINEATASLKKGKDTLIMPTSSYDKNDLQLSVEVGEKLGKSLSEVGTYVQNIIGMVTKEILSQTEVSGLFVTGGDTALGVLTQIQAKGSEILSEIEIGIPMMRVIGGKFDGLKVVTKAGAFGNEASIEFAIRKLKEELL